MQNPDLPRQLVRAMIMNLRFSVQWQIELAKTYEAMPASWQGKYKQWVEVPVSTFDDAMTLIDQALSQGIIDQDEAASLRACKPIPLVFE